MRTVREWLQLEMWSPRTTKKLYVVVGVLSAIGFVWRYWLNPIEVRATRATLVQARRIRTARQEDLQKETAKGNELEAKADAAAWTYRDHALEIAAGSTLFFARTCRKEEFNLGKAFPSVQKVIEEDRKATGGCVNAYESLDSILRRRIDTNSGFLGF